MNEEAKKSVTRAEGENYEVVQVWTVNGVKHARLRDKRTGEYSTFAEKGRL